MNSPRSTSPCTGWSDSGPIRSSIVSNRCSTGGVLAPAQGGVFFISFRRGKRARPDVARTTQDAMVCLQDLSLRQTKMIDMNSTAIDCDVHPTVLGMKALLPYLDDFWRETVEERGINSLETVTYPPQCAAHVPPAVSRQARPRSDQRRRGCDSGLRPVACRHRHLQLPLWRRAVV